MRRNEGHVTGRVINNVIVYEYKNRGIPRKRWMNCVNEDMRMEAVSARMTADRSLWQVRTCCAPIFLKFVFGDSKAGYFLDMMFFFGPRAKEKVILSHPNIHTQHITNKFHARSLKIKPYVICNTVITVIVFTHTVFTKTVIGVSLLRMHW